MSISPIKSCQAVGMAQLAQSIENWPTIEEAAAQLNTSLRTMWRHAKARRIETQKRPRPGKKPENVCNPRDLERLKPAAHVMPAEEPTAGSPEPNGNGLARINDERFTFAYVLQEILRRNGAPPPAPLPWITLQEAVAASGLSAGYLRRAIQEGKIEAVRGGPHGALRIRRGSLEAFVG